MGLLNVSSNSDLYCFITVKLDVYNLLPRLTSHPHDSISPRAHARATAWATPAAAIEWTNAASLDAENTSND